MPTAELGESGRAVARNVQRLRQDQGMSLRDLEARLRELGRPILPSGLHKIEQGTRRVDADDLAALAKALGVRPRWLLSQLDEHHRAHRPLTAAERDRNADIIDAAVSAVREAVSRGLPVYGVLDYLEASCAGETTLVYDEDYLRQEQELIDQQRKGGTSDGDR